MTEVVVYSRPGLPPLRGGDRGDRRPARRGLPLRTARGRHRERRAAAAAPPGADPGGRGRRRRRLRAGPRRGGRAGQARYCGGMVEVIDEIEAAAGLSGRRRAPLARRRRAPLALPAGADPGAQDGPRDDLLAGALRVHPHQPDPDPPRPLRLRQVRQARGRLQRRLAGRGDPQDPPHLGPAQHRPLRRRQPRPGDRQLGDLRRPRLPGGGRLRRRPGRGRQARSASLAVRDLDDLRAGRRRGGDRRRRPRRPRRAPPRRSPTASSRPG